MGDVQRSARLGLTVEEQTSGCAWQGRGSHPSWVVGEGHKPLVEARVIALDELAKAEKLVDDRREALVEAQKARTRAVRVEAEAEKQLDEARHSLAYHQEDLARRCGVVWDHPEEDAKGTGG